ncbi:T9SS type A sorting domain-containing protein [Ferruginibacter sp. SUN106]|uniref:T9SS type A sorting domain-containing protein n=1 Tax=Ferruginibacter sp. SUN106 TaxID=2978348 RepID=UPI003D363DDB
MKKTTTRKKIQLLAVLLLLLVNYTFAQAPGGVSSPAANVPGMRYELYNGTTTVANLATASYGTLKQTGYTSSLYDFDDRFTSEIANSFTLVGKAGFTITVAGSYSFSMNALDDAAIILIDGVTEVYRGNVSAGLGTVATTITPVTLSAGMHTIEIRFTDNGGGVTCEPTWKGNAAGLDAGTSFVQMPDNKFILTTAALGTWHKADAGIVAVSDAIASSWADQSANTFKTDMTSIVGTGPIYRSAATGLFNFNPTLQFTNNGAMRSNDDAYNLAYATQGRTTFVVSSSANTTDQGNMMSYGRDNGTATSAFVLENVDKLVSGLTFGTNVNTANVFNVANQPVLSVAKYQNTSITASNNNSQYANGYLRGTTTQSGTGVEINDNQDYFIGTLVDNGGSIDYLEGNIAEVINYPWDLSNTERNKVESYLAIKYGITLGNTSNLVNYTNSAGTTTWSADAVFQNNILGIARDDASALNQKQSQSQNQGTALIVSNGTAGFAVTNNANSNSFSTNLQSLIMGDNNLSTAMNVNVSGITYRMAEAWKVQDAGGVGIVTLAYPVTAFSSVTNPQLIYANNSAFSGYGLIANAGTAMVNGVVCYLFNYDFSDNATSYFSFGGTATAPGGVLAPAASVNGMKYEIYNGVVADRATIIAGTYGSLKQVGYTNTMYNFNTVLQGSGSSSEFPGGNFTVVGKASLTITNAGAYQFQMQNIDDYGAIFIDGNLAYADEFGGAAATINTQNLSAGAHNIEIRFSGGALPNLCQPQWKGTTAGLDAGTSFAQLPDSKLFMDPLLGTWHRADAGVTGSEGVAASAWADQSANGNLTNLTAGGTSPIYRTSTNLQNFNPTIEFGGAGYFESADDANNLPYAQQGTTSFAVASRSGIATGTTDVIFSYGDDFGTASMNFINNVSNKLRTGTNNYPATAVQSTADAFTSVLKPAIGVQNYQNNNLVATLNNSQMVDGASSATAITDAGTYRFLNDNRDFNIGREVDGGNPWNGSISEIITYPWPLSTTEKLRVNSYLGIKYGITLAAGTSSYVFSDASGTNDMWTPANNTGYINDIAGISRDDASGLYQKQSQSVNDNAFVTLGLGTIAISNAANNNTISSDKSSLVWSANQATAPVLTDNANYSVSAQGFNTILDKKWKVQLSGSGLAGKTIRVGIAATNGIIPATESYLIVSTTGAFNATNETYYPLATNSNYIYADVPTSVLSNATYFTFGHKIIAPGGVTPNLSVWLSADSNYVAGATDTWTARNTTGYKVQQATAAKKPVFNTVTNAFNFNPVVTFDGSNDELISAAGNIPLSAITTTSGDAPSSQFVVYKSSSTSGLAVYNYASNSGGIYAATYTDAGTFYIQQNTVTAATTVANKVTLASMAGARNTATGQKGLNGNMSTATFGNFGTYLTSDQLLNVGSGGGANYLPGSIGEIILYNNPVSIPNNVQRVNSYLALKYGITQGSTASPVDYLNTRSTAMWTGNATYQNNVAGIGRDDNEALIQKQSRSVNTPVNRQVTIGLGTIATTNAGNTNVFANDLSYLVWGDNGQTNTLGADITAATAPTFVYNAPGTNYRMQRVWKAVTTNFGQAVKVSVDGTGVIGTVSLIGSCTKLCLVTASDAAFTTNVTTTILTVEGSNYVCNTVFPAGTSYFSFARVQVKPEGTVYLPVAASTAVPVYSGCPQEGWQYYYSDGTAASGTTGLSLGDGTRKIFALYANGNTIPANLTGNVTYQAAPYSVSNGTPSTLNIMGRLLTITDPTAGTYSAGGGMKVRVFYDPAELSASLVPAPVISQKWFKFEGDATAAVAANTGSTITGAAFFTGLTTGTEDGISYVEYAGIQNFSTFGFASNNGLSNPLPIVLNEFAAKLQDCKVLLNWRSADEPGFSLYEVEYSKDGVNFSTIAQVTAKGNNSSYQYTYPAPDGRSYYRIKLLSSDIATAKYSQTVTVNSNCNSTKILIFPNPVNTVINVNLSNYIGKVNGQLYNAQGQLVQNISLINGANTINCQNITSGIYNLRVTTVEGKSEVYKIQVVH